MTAANKNKTALAPTRGEHLARARRGVEQLYRAARASEREYASQLKRLLPSTRNSGRNLVHYLSARRHDLRPLQDALAHLGLSSLGRMEGHVMPALLAVRAALSALSGKPVPVSEEESSFDEGTRRLTQHTLDLLGPPRSDDGVRIMVTMPSEAADDPALIRDLVQGGMSIMRINCAHDGPRVWLKMVRHLRQAVRETGLQCLISFDLAGPKLRTGDIDSGLPVVKWRPQRNALGEILAPARLHFIRRPPGQATPELRIQMHGSCLRLAEPGDVVELTDTRGRERLLHVVERNAEGFVCEANTTAYVVPGIPVILRRDDRVIGTGSIGAVPAYPQWLTLRVGDDLDIIYGDAPGRNAVRNGAGVVVEPASVSCDLPEVFEGVRAGHRILFDDGRIAAVIRSASKTRLRAHITQVRGGIAKLRGEKGINLPDSKLKLPALTAKDIEDLKFVVRHGDMVALSFVRSPQDVQHLYEHLDRLKAAKLGVILKIETRAAFQHLPAVLLTAMQREPLGVMVARGDLGVEIGFERLSEVQEEMLWLCEAAHVPVIWATQVLESLAKGGMPSRAEVTDAAMAGRAECVMLNKGPYIRETLAFLVDVLHRMASHQQKKTSRLRRLRVSVRPRVARVRTRPTRRRVRAAASAPAD